MFTGHMLDSQGYNVSSSGQRRFWSDCADAQANLSVRCAHTPEGTFTHVLVHLVCRWQNWQSVGHCSLGGVFRLSQKTKVVATGSIPMLIVFCLFFFFHPRSVYVFFFF